MAFLSVGFGPTRDFPVFLQTIADALPLTYLVDIVQGVVYGREAGSRAAEAVAVPPRLGVAGTVTAMRYFAWNPGVNLRCVRGPETP